MAVFTTISYTCEKGSASRKTDKINKKDRAVAIAAAFLKLLADGVDLSDKRNGGLVEAAELSIISLSAHQKSKREVAFFDKVAFRVARNRASRAT